MSIVRSYGKEEILINENKIIIIETKEEDGYEWKEVTYKSNDEIKIGSYYTYNYTSSIEWMEYNDDYIVLLIIHKGGHVNSKTLIKKMFNIKLKQFVYGSQEQLLEVYNKSFKGNAKKKILTKK